MNLDNKKLIGLGLVMFLVMQNSNGGKNTNNGPVTITAGAELTEPAETYGIIPKIAEVMTGDDAKHDARVLAYMMYNVGKVLEEDGQTKEPKYRTKENAMDLLNRGKMSSQLKGSYPGLLNILVTVTSDLKLQTHGPLNDEARANFVAVAKAFAWAFYAAST